MAQIGRINKLKIKKQRDYGVHLDGGDSGDILLKNKHAPENCQPGDEGNPKVPQGGAQVHGQDRPDRPRSSGHRCCRRGSGTPASCGTTSSRQRCPRRRAGSTVARRAAVSMCTAVRSVVAASTCSARSGTSSICCRTINCRA